MNSVTLASVNDQARASDPTRIKLELAILLALWAISFYPVYPGLVHTWLNHPNNSHGILVPLICLYFIWQKREKLTLTEVSGCGLGGAILIGSMGCYVLSLAGAVTVVSRLMIVSSLIGLVLFTLGKTIFKTVAFPLCFLFFMVPVPDSIVAIVAFPLQLFATKVSSFFIGMLSIPVYREGNMLYFAKTQLEVAEACSGIRSLISIIMISVIFLYLLKGGWIKRAIFFASAVPVALLANILRVSGTGVLAHFYGEKVARGFLHEFSGLAVFAFGFLLLYLEYLLLNKTDIQK